MFWNCRQNTGRLNLLWLFFFSLTFGNISLAEPLSTDPDLNAFENRYKEIQNSVSSGKLSKEVGERSKELRFTLNKAIIELNARKEVLKLEVTEFEGKRQLTALDDLMSLGAERQRTIARAQHQLEALAGSAGSLAPVAPVIAQPPQEKSPPGAEKKSSQFDADQIKEIRGIIGIELVPEDITTGEFE